MSGGAAAKECSGSSMADESGSSQVNQYEKTSKWTRLLMPENGGPGEPPGREEAIAEAKALTAERYELHGKKKAKGSSASKPKATVSREKARKAGW